MIKISSFIFSLLKFGIKKHSVVNFTQKMLLLKNISKQASPLTFKTKLNHKYKLIVSYTISKLGKSI